MGAVVETEPLRNRAHLVVALSKHENRCLDANSLDVFHRRNAHLLAEDVREVGCRESGARAQVLDAQRVIDILRDHATHGSTRSGTELLHWDPKGVGAEQVRNLGKEEAEVDGLGDEDLRMAS